MDTSMGRRVFVGSVVAGLPLLASSSGRSFAQSGAAQTHVHSGAGVVDPVLDHIARQLAFVYNSMRQDPRGEHVRAFASQLRTLAVYSRRIDLDAQLTSALHDLIERDGRDALLYREPDRDHLRAELKRYGLSIDNRLSAPSNLDHAQRSAALASLLRGGVTGGWERMAAILERGAPEVDRRVIGLVRVSRQITYDAAYWEGSCKEL